MECCQDGAGLLWLEGEKDPHSSHPPGPAPGCRGLRLCIRALGGMSSLQGPFSSDCVREVEKSCPLHFECMLHGMWTQAVRLLECIP